MWDTLSSARCAEDSWGTHCPQHSPLSTELYLRTVPSPSHHIFTPNLIKKLFTLNIEPVYKNQDTSLNSWT